MKTLTIASLVAAQLVAAPVPAVAASFQNANAATTQAGTFAGMRVRLALGRSAPARPRVSLGVAPLLRSQAADGAAGLRFGEGVSLGFSPGQTARLTFAGRPLGHFAPTRAEIDKTNASGVSTLGWVAIGVGATALLVLGAFALCQETNCTNSD